MFLRLRYHRIKLAARHLQHRGVSIDPFCEGIVFLLGPTSLKLAAVLSFAI